MDNDEGQMLILDFCFHPDYTDQLAVVYLNMQGEIINISHES